MADEVDIANEQNQFFSDLAIQKARQNTGPKLEPQEECYACGEEFEEGSLKLFCNGKCAADYERKKIR